ncbi:MAG TPA: hypothetical protein VJ761_21910 [Ktedonobacteraceae bacterium]|nr:hypothetical protein [Ktedonobacteraceae bacterium]
MGEQAGALSVFCGYAHEDQALFRQLKTALAVFIRQGLISVWHNGVICAKLT